MNPLSNISKLKIGDYIRVPFTDEITGFDTNSGAVQVRRNRGNWVSPHDPTISSIELLERPLKVGDRVKYKRKGSTLIFDAGVLVGVGKTYGVVQWENGEESALSLSDIMRIP